MNWDYEIETWLSQILAYRHCEFMPHNQHDRALKKPLIDSLSPGEEGVEDARVTLQSFPYHCNLLL